MSVHAIKSSEDSSLKVAVGDGRKSLVELAKKCGVGPNGLAKIYITFFERSTPSEGTKVTYDTESEIFKCGNSELHLEIEDHLSNKISRVHNNTSQRVREALEEATNDDSYLEAA